MTLLSKRFKFKGIHQIIVTSVLALNFLGITYAHWDQGFEVITNITTTNLNPRFLTGHIEGGNKGLNIDVNDELIRITGKIDYDYSWRDFQYIIQNKSDIPIRVFLPDKAGSQKLYKNDVVKLDVPLEQSLYYEIICEQAID